MPESPQPTCLIEWSLQHGIPLTNGNSTPFCHIRKDKSAQGPEFSICGGRLCTASGKLALENGCVSLSEDQVTAALDKLSQNR